tara:strand:- start:5049 stop:5852 length:804 start_codon:yes stop_codon:yes gene_type:complete
MNEECRTAIEDYYTLKKDYDQSYATKRKAIISDNRIGNTKQKKRDAIKGIKMACVHCKRLVGSLFSTENRTLIAKCGDMVAPCPLNIKIYKGRVTKLDDDFTLWYEDYIKELTETIVKTKLDVLFQYITEEDAVKVFQETKEQLELYKMGYNTDFTLYLEKTSNSDNLQDLSSSNKKLLDFKGTLKELLEGYYKTKDKRVFEEIVGIYVTNIVPLLETIRELKYKYIQLEYDSDDDIVELKTRTYQIRDIETNTNEEDEPRVLSNIK